MLPNLIYFENNMPKLRTSGHLYCEDKRADHGDPCGPEGHLWEPV